MSTFKERRKNFSLPQMYEDWSISWYYQPHKDDIESRIGKPISLELYREIIEKMEDIITYDDYVEPFLKCIESYVMDEIEKEME